MRPEGDITRGTTNPSRLRRVDRWITQAQAGVLLATPRPLVVDLGYGASPVTTLELYRRVRAVAPDAEVTGLEIDRERVRAAGRLLAGLRAAGEELPGLSFAAGGFELPLPRRPAVVRAFNVLRQYPEERAWGAWSRLRSGLADGGVLVEGTCDEIGRRAVWVTLPAGTCDDGALITFSARLASLERPSGLAERLPKTLIHRNVPGEPVHEFLRDFDRAWDHAAPYAAFGSRHRWLAAVAALSATWPVLRYPPYGGRRRWRLGEVSLPWNALAPPGQTLALPGLARVPWTGRCCSVAVRFKRTWGLVRHISDDLGRAEAWYFPGRRRARALLTSQAGRSTRRQDGRRRQRGGSRRQAGSPTRPGLPRRRGGTSGSPRPHRRSGYRWEASPRRSRRARKRASAGPRRTTSWSATRPSPGSMPCCAQGLTDGS